MNDARWTDVLMAVDSAVRHFTHAVRPFDEVSSVESDQDMYRSEMALMHAMQSGYTSFESALLRTIKLIGERPPVDEDWHKQLIERSARDLPGRRPAILPADLVPLTRRLRGFRHWAAHGYDDSFDPNEAARAVEAARQMLPLLRQTFETFISAIDR